MTDFVEINIHLGRRKLVRIADIISVSEIRGGFCEVEVGDIDYRLSDTYADFTRRLEEAKGG